VVPSNSDRYEREVLAKARASGLLNSGMLRFVDPGHDVLDVLAALDVFVLPSRVEGVATATLEAMVAGLPVVAYDVGSLRDVVKHGQTGFLAPSGDLGSLTEHVFRLIRDPELRRHVGSRASSLSRQLSAPDATAAAHAAAWTSALHDAGHSLSE
jgi:glycosyltransferase involved in cell wall biosynthesis